MKVVVSWEQDGSVEEFCYDDISHIKEESKWVRFVTVDDDWICYPYSHLVMFTVYSDKDLY